MTGSAKQSSYPRRDGLHRRFAPRNDGLNILAKFELGAYDRFDRSNTRVRLLAGISPISMRLRPKPPASPSPASTSRPPPSGFSSRRAVWEQPFVIRVVFRPRLEGPQRKSARPPR